MRTFLVVLLVIVSLTMIVAIMLQPTKSDGINSLISGGNQNYFAKNRIKTRETMLARITVVTSVLFAIIVMAINLM
ncbi:preprotein translocase subunit SecG [Clostridium tepidiprofundi DSM 19306]|uniref:Protein-export membrane protein SecG n=1 Tax=Clostridium tepidiprofundi DSM 19306 TaxID=1121338 RepID=A0A151B438_9CLOT|nr:preprotein translocase subunit SecG [Clostridium tepidiprofundi]KYH34678.1 preprotein translocase subunit SecG [Clostridium tepidiprofundi DSM 19306]